VGEWRRVKIGDILKRSKVPIVIENDKQFKRVTIRTKHQGVSLRDVEIGKMIGTKNQFVLKSGQFVLSKIDARFGAFGIAPDEVDGAIITGNFWAFDIDETVASAEWINNYTNSPAFYDLCERASSGITHRRYLDESKFVGHELYVPLIDDQKKKLEQFSRWSTTYADFSNQIEQQQTLFKQLRQAVLQEAVEGKLTADWRRQHPLVKGDPQHDAAALRAQIKAEKERLVKAGKIRKEKPLPTIADCDKPYELPAGWVWCKIDELVSSLHSDIRTGPFGTSLQKHEHKSSGVPVWGIESIDKKGAFTGKNKIFVTAEKASELKSFAVAAKDIIISRSGTVGELCCLPDDVIYGLISTNLMKISLNRTVVSPDYFCLLFKGTKSIDAQLEELCFGTTRLFLTQSILTQLLFPLPPLAEQQAIVARVESLMATIDALEAQRVETQNLASLLMQAVLREAFATSGAVV